LRPEKTSEVLSLMQAFDLQPIDLGQHTRMAADSFHDVADVDEAASN